MTATTPLKGAPMKVYEVEFQALVIKRIRVEAPSLGQAVALAKAKRKTVPVKPTELLAESVERVDCTEEESRVEGGSIVGSCEACGVSLIEGHSEYGYDGDGIYTCAGECIDGVNQ